MNKSEREFYRQFSQHGTGDAKVDIAAKANVDAFLVTDFGTIPTFNVALALGLTTIFEFEFLI